MTISAVAASLCSKAQEMARSICVGRQMRPGLTRLSCSPDPGPVTRILLSPKYYGRLATNAILGMQAIPRPHLKGQLLHAGESFRLATSGG